MTISHSAAKSGVVGTLIVSLLSLSGCVDHDYDLTEDIDMTVQIGSSELSLPLSSTDLLTLDQIFDLESQSSIIAVENEGDYGLSAGDYVLLQEGDTRPATFKVDPVDIRDFNGSTGRTELPDFVNTGEHMITRRANPTINAVNLSDDDVTDELISLSSARMAVDLIFEVAYESDHFSGRAYIEEGYKAVFPDYWTIELVDEATRNNLRLVDNHTVEFKRQCTLDRYQPFTAKVRLTDVDFSKAPAGQGLYSVGHFRMNADVSSEGLVSISGDDLPYGERAKLELVTRTSVEHAVIESITGVVDPRISVDPTDFELTDIPEFLKDSENHLDVENPMIYVAVRNSSPLSLTVNGEISSYTDNTVGATCNVGSNYGRPVEVAGNSTSLFVFSRRAVSVAGAVNVVVPELGEIVNTLPDRILFHNISCEALPVEAHYDLGHTYDFDCDYEAVVPLSFGADMRLHYTHTDTGWNEDLDKYNFDTVEISLDVENSIPMAMTPKVEALGNNEQVLSNITATVDGFVGAGSLSSPGKSKLVITLKSTAQNIGALDGMRLIFDGASSADYIGTNLNKAQSLRFDNIKITVRGGITADLND